MKLAALLGRFAGHAIGLTVVLALSAVAAVLLAFTVGATIRLVSFGYHLGLGR